MPINPITTYRAFGLQPVINPLDASEVPVNLKPSTIYAAGTVLGEMIGTDEANTITLSATGGSWKFIWGGVTSAPIPQSATAAAVQAILEAMSNIGAGNVLVSGAAGGPYLSTFRSALGSQNTSNVTTDPALLTGGSGTATVTNTTPGVAGTPGTYAPYASGNSDGSQIAKGLLRFPCVTDANGMISFGTGTTGSVEEWNQAHKAADMYISGNFRTEDLVGLDATAISALGRIVYGNVHHGVIALFGS